MRVLIDGNSLQARHHRQDDQRLSTLLSESRRRHRVDFASGDRITPEDLAPCQVLVVATRYPQPYTAEEIQVIRGFVEPGGGLLLLTNHADLPGRNPTDTRKFDARLAEGFGINIQQTFFRNRLKNVPTVLAGEALNSHHPIIAGVSATERVQSVVTNTCSSIRCEQGQALVSLSRDMADRRTGKPPLPDQLFAHALDLAVQPDSDGKGRLVTVADSGFIGSRWTEVPGPGLITWGDNLRFIRNAILWAGGEIG